MITDPDKDPAIDRTGDLNYLPTWFKVFGGVVLLVGVIGFSCGLWAVYRIVEHFTR